jgi:group I intron endonuclease
MPSGIYKIEHVASGRSYIGSAVCLKRRLAKHKTELSTHRHCNQRLQRAWDKYGEAAFTMSTIETVESKEDLIVREQHWIDRLGSVVQGFNICPTAGSALGIKKSPESIAKTAAAHRGMKRSEETRARIREARARQAPFSPETRAKLAAIGKGWKPSQEMMARSLAANRQEDVP